MTYAELVTDYWAHAHCDDPKLREQEVDDDFSETLREMGFDEADLAAVKREPEADSEVIASANYGGDSA